MKLRNIRKFVKSILSTKKFKHSKRVAALMTTKSEKRVALLHDVLEQCPDALLAPTEQGYALLHNEHSVAITKEEHDALRAITRRTTESYKNYIVRVTCNKLATKVKIADILDRKSIELRHLKAVKALLKD